MRCDQTGKKRWREIKTVKQSIPIVFSIKIILTIVYLYGNYY
jgi:hypothetical protein